MICKGGPDGVKGLGVLGGAAPLHGRAAQGVAWTRAVGQTADGHVAGRLKEDRCVAAHAACQDGVRGQRVWQEQGQGAIAHNAAGRVIWQRSSAQQAWLRAARPLKGAPRLVADVLKQGSRGGTAPHRPVLCMATQAAVDSAAPQLCGMGPATDVNEMSNTCRFIDALTNSGSCPDMPVPRSRMERMPMGSKPGGGGGVTSQQVRVGSSSNRAGQASQTR